MDIEILLEPVDGENPSGAELRNDARYHAVERLLEPAAKTARTTATGEINPSATPVQWDDIENEGLALAKDGRDLRLLVVMVRVAYAQDGFAGLAAGLEMLSQSLNTYWDNLHPALRDRDDARAAATPRINALKQLENDDNGLLGDLKFTPVLNPRGVGPILGYDLSVATLTPYEMQTKSVSGLSQAELDEVSARHTLRVNRVKAATGALNAEEPEKAAAMLADVGRSEAAADALCAAFRTAGGFKDSAPLNLPELVEFLQMVRATLEAAMSDTKSDVTPAPQAAPEATPASPAAAPVANGAAPSAPGAVSSRADVEKALESIIGFYERTEPSSPIPLLAQRMRRMVRMDFLELMEEIAPSGMKEFKNVAGVEDARKK